MANASENTEYSTRDIKPRYGNGNKLVAAIEHT